MTYQKEQEKVKKLYVDFEATISLNSRNKQIEKYATNLLKNSPRSYQLAVSRLYNVFNTLQMVCYQICLPALPYSPTILILILIAVELSSTLAMIIPFIFHFRFISWLEFASKITRFICMETFLTVCLLISLRSRKMTLNKQKGTWLEN